MFPAIAALLGSLITGGFAVFLADRQAERTSKDRRRERDETRRDAQDKAAEEAAFEALAVARHLEAYARECADVATDPEEHLEGAARIRSTPTLKPYNNVHWPRLGARATAEAMDLLERHRLRRGYVVGDAMEEGGDERGRARVYGDGSARLGLDAWHVAVGLRQRANLPAFEFAEDGWNFAAALEARVAEAERRQAARESVDLT